MEKGVKNYLLSKPLFYAGIASIVLIFASLISNSLFSIFGSGFVNFLYYVVICLASIIIFYGFYVIGDKYNNGFLKVLSLLGIIGTVIFYLSVLSFQGPANLKILELNQTIMEYNQTIASLNSTGNLSSSQLDNLTLEVSSRLLGLVAPFLFIFVLVFLIFVIYSILFGVSLIKLDKKVKYAKIAGILEIVGASTIIIGVGIFVLMAAFVFEVMILFDQAKKFKEY